MKLTCLNCGHEFDGRIFRDEIAWNSQCPECLHFFDAYVPNGNIIMAFTDPDDDDDDDPYKYFTECWEDADGIHTWYAFDTPEEFLAKWEEIYDKPNGMWYWVVVDGYCICSGACDPGDIDIFEDYWEDELATDSGEVFAVRYTETFHRVYYVKANDFEEAKEKVGNAIMYGRIDEPIECCDSNYEDVTADQPMHKLCDDYLDIK